jgi:hypothetical protein
MRESSETTVFSSSSKSVRRGPESSRTAASVLGAVAIGAAIDGTGAMPINVAFRITLCCDWLMAIAGAELGATATA